MLSSADAAIVDWTVAPFAFDDGGSVSGSFSTDTTAGVVTSFNLVTTPGATLGGYTFDQAASFVFYESPAVRLVLMSNDGNHQLYLQYFVADLYTAAVGFLPWQAASERFYNGTDWISRTSPGFNFPTEAGIYSNLATPLPGALPLFASGLGALGIFAWRRRRAVGAQSAP